MFSNMDNLMATKVDAEVIVVAVWEDRYMVHLQVPPTPSRYGVPPPAIPGQQQLNHNPTFSNVTKYFNNWNMCYTCGWDVPVWHNSESRPHNASNPGHYRMVVPERIHSNISLLGIMYTGRQCKRPNCLITRDHNKLGA
jgi:hypothetical protein